jgi:threonine dehydratase
VLVSIGGGALIAGVALRTLPVWGAETEGADAMARALAAGEPLAITSSSIASTLSAPHVSQATLDHVRQQRRALWVERLPVASHPSGIEAMEPAD